MAAINPPWTLENLATHHANVNRMFMSAITGRGEGVVYGFAVAQRGAGANMSVDIAKGAAVIFGDDNEQQGTYGVVNDATTNVVIAAADPTNPRIDLVVARVRDSFYSGGTNAWAMEIVQGTAAGSPVDPAVPNGTLTLARVAIAAAAGSILNANITDLRPFTPVGITPTNSARPPGTLYGPFSQEPAFKPTPTTGHTIIEQDTGRLKTYDGTAYRYVAGGPQPQYAMRAWRSAALSAAAAPSTLLILMDNITYDYNSNFSLGTGKYTVPVTGLYDVRGAVSFGLASNPEEDELNIYKNAAIHSSGGRVKVGGTGGDTFNLVVADSIACAAGDLLDLRMDHITGGNPTPLVTGSSHCFLTIRKV